MIQEKEYVEKGYINIPYYDTISHYYYIGSLYSKKLGEVKLFNGLTSGHTIAENTIEKIIKELGE